jgi:hypothetical protein
MGGGGSIQDMNNRIRDNRAMLGRRKLRMKSGRRFFDKKPSMLVNKGTFANLKNVSESQLEEIKKRRKKEASYNQVVVLIILMICIALLVWTIYIIMT